MFVSMADTTDLDTVAPEQRPLGSESYSRPTGCDLCLAEYFSTPILLLFSPLLPQRLYVFKQGSASGLAARDPVGVHTTGCSC